MGSPISPRLLEIAKLVPKNSCVLDIGTDHAYLPIYLSKNNICKSIIASDISENALASGRKNLKKYNVKNVKLVLSDGLENITETYDVITISGMGTSTILKILNNKNLPNNLIISSNNDLHLLRKSMNEKGYTIKKELAIKDSNKYYDIISYEKGKEKLSFYQLLYGKSKNKDYYKYLLSKEKYIFYKSKKIKHLKNIIYLIFKTI